MTTEFRDPFSEEIWNTTYKDHNDITIDDTLKRVARAIASVEKTNQDKKVWEENFFEMLSDFKIVPGGRILSNAGTEWKGTTLINCFVAPRRTFNIDSLDNIMLNLNNQAQTLKSEGGWGENFSYIRPRGSMIYDIGAETPGSVKFMELFDKSSDVITAGSGRKNSNTKAKGKIRKGAQMSVLDCWHPDVIEFITAKQQPGRLTKFNISVNCTDEFMDRVVKLKSGSLSKQEFVELNKWDLQFPDTQWEQYRTEWNGNIADWKAKGYPVITYNTVEVLWLWELIMKSTYNRAEPGVLFLDRANYFNPLSYAEKISATNPCGEQVLAPGGICCLGSLNLVKFLNKEETDFDYSKLEKYASYLVRFLDNVNSYSEVPLSEYKFNMENKRRIGVGILGWGSVLYMLKMRYGSEQATKLREKLMSSLASITYKASIDLAEEKEMFSLCDPKKHANAPFVKKLNLPQKYLTKLLTTGIRNSSLLSIQPTGNTSILANVVSGGCEPVFLHEYLSLIHI